LGLHFFGLTPEYRAELFKGIHEIVFHGKGGYSFDTVYNFPIWLRRFTFRTMLDWYTKENKEKQAQSGQQSLLQDGKIKAPDYSTKASR
jgi:hypothetical protein